MLQIVAFTRFDDDWETHMDALEHYERAWESRPSPKTDVSRIPSLFHLLQNIKFLPLVLRRPALSTNERLQHVHVPYKT